MPDETRRAVADYAVLKGQTIAEVLENELVDIVLHMQKLYRVRRDAAAAETQRTTLKVDVGNGTR